ncbi:hypothetical protein N499_1064A, partial [Wolbachia pipientis wVitA]
MCIKFLS